MFIDKARIKIVAGKGGDGAKSFDFSRKSDGGDGGRGGNVLVKGSTHMRDLVYFVMGERKFKAENGIHGGKNKLTGAKGDDLILELPVGTIIYDEDTKELLAKIEDSETLHFLAKGGRGGLGNYHFRGKFGYERERTIPGFNGQEVNIELELRLKADICFIGFPNAGKSSMLNALSNANVKVASYAFTTLEPNLGFDGDLRYMDLPGLIEGTVDGKGLGTRFTKHAEECSVVAHFISLESLDLVDDYKKMRKEMSSISKVLANKPEVIVLTKADLFSETDIQSAIKLLQKFNKSIISVSSFKKELVSEFRKYMKEFVKANEKN